jgi:hypothetical protein
MIRRVRSSPQSLRSLKIPKGPLHRLLVVLFATALIGPMGLPGVAAQSAPLVPHDCRGPAISEGALWHQTSGSSWIGVRSRIWFPSGSSESPCIQQVVVAMLLPNLDRTIYFGWYRGWRPYYDPGQIACSPSAFPDYTTSVQLWAKVDGASGRPCVFLTPPGMSRGVYHNVQIVRSPTSSRVYLLKLDTQTVWQYDAGSTQSGPAYVAGAFRFYDASTEPGTSNAGRWNNIQTLNSSRTWVAPGVASWIDADNVSGHNFVAQNLPSGPDYLNECTHVSGGSCPGT